MDGAGRTADAPAADWQRIRAVAFDLDGTLYEARPLRRRMTAELLLHCLRRPRELATARILHRFRRCREELAEEEAPRIGREQYERAARELRLPAERVEATVREWMLERPLPYLAACRRAGARRLFARLRESGRAIGVFSDYPVTAKLAALGLECDAAVSAMDPEVDRLKPDPAGLARLLELLAVPAGDTLVIGDRDERDGECARRLGCPYLLVGPRSASPHRLASFPEILHSLDE